MTFGLTLLLEQEMVFSLSDVQKDPDILKMSLILYTKKALIRIILSLFSHFFFYLVVCLQFGRAKSKGTEVKIYITAKFLGHSFPLPSFSDTKGPFLVLILKANKISCEVIILLRQYSK